MIAAYEFSRREGVPLTIKNTGVCFVLCAFGLVLTDREILV